MCKTLTSCIILQSIVRVEYERGRLDIEKLRWSMSVECVSELRRFYDSQEVIEEEQRLREQKEKKEEEKVHQKVDTEISNDSVPDEVDEAIFGEDSTGTRQPSALFIYIHVFSIYLTTTLSPLPLLHD